MLLAHGYFTKAVNYLIANINMVKQPNYATNYPTTVVIDTGNICNLSCALCITGQKKSPRSKTFLSFENFQKIINRLGKTACQLDLYNWGEPLLNKDVFKMIAYAKKFGLRVETSSNLLLLTPFSAKKLIKSGLDRLIVSLHGASPKITKIYMRNGDFNKAIANLKMLLAIKEKLKSETPRIDWRFVVSRYNEGELAKAEKLAKSFGVGFEPVPICLDVGFDPEVIKRNIRKHSFWLPKNKKYCVYDIKKQKFLSKASGCWWPWEIIAINSDGTTHPCCVYSNPEYSFGNFFKIPFEEIWNGSKYQTARKVIREKIKTDKSTLCGSCVSAGFIG